MDYNRFGVIFMNYEELLEEADNNELIVKEKALTSSDGRIYGNRIAIRKDTPIIQKKCVLAEELGHYKTAIGNILDQKSVVNRKLEQKGRIYAYNKLIGLTGIVHAYEKGCQSRYEIAEYLEVTEEFLEDAICYYRQKYGCKTTIDNYVIFLEPSLAVMKII